jgi:hypothetical protein
MLERFRGLWDIHYKIGRGISLKIGGYKFDKYTLGTLDYVVEIGMLEGLNGSLFDDYSISYQF